MTNDDDERSRRAAALARIRDTRPKWTPERWRVVADLLRPGVTAYLADQKAKAS